MIQITCGCGTPFEVPESAANAPARCAGCNGIIRPVAAEQLPENAGAGDFDAHLLVEAGPAHVGERYPLGGVAEIELGKLPTKHIVLPGTRVSRNHAKLVRLDFGPSRWQIVDTNSTNGVLINGQRISEHELQQGDVIEIGEYRLRYLSLFDAPAPAGASAAAVSTGGPLCPSCQKTLAPGAKICVGCGIYIDTGKPLVTSKGFDEDALAVRADTWIRIVSWIVWFGLFPVASEAFGTRKPLVTWVIAALTVVVSVCFFIAIIAADAGEGLLNLMLWSGDAAQNDLLIDEFGYMPDIGFRWYQLLTHALLHGGIMHLAGNLLFLLVFGMRVNELIGNAKMAIVYPLLAALAGLTHLLANQHEPLHPMLGASGAIMGLAGMYFVFFPVHKVYMAIWIRAGIFTGWRCFYKVFRMGGFWLLVLWIGFSDVLPMLLGSEDGVAHWAHMGGFVAGAAAALLLLLTRLVNARGGDILSVSLGKRAWALLGKPAQGEAVLAAPRAISMNYE